jgi:uncharacterized membrane protein YsdA (DUF1294 family)
MMLALQVIGVLYLLMSLIALVVYWYDKKMAQDNKMRVPEKTLHWLEALGGWPGALLAQRWFRHKTQKQPFQNIFRLIVLGHIVLWGLAGFLYNKLSS